MSARQSRNNFKWSSAEDKRLEELYSKDKYSFKKIATDLHRSLDAIQARFVKQVLATKYSPSYLLENKEALAKHHNINLDDFTRYLKYTGIRETHTSRYPPSLSTSDSESDNSDEDSSDGSWHPSDDSDSSDSSDSDYDSDIDEDTQDKQHYFLQKQKERKQVQEKLNNIMKYLEMLNKKIDKLDKKYK